MKPDKRVEFARSARRQVRRVNGSAAGTVKEILIYACFHMSVVFWQYCRGEQIALVALTIKSVTRSGERCMRLG